MSALHDASSASADVSSVTSYSWLHTPVGTPRAAFVAVVSMDGAPLETGVEYAGIPMSAVAGTVPQDTAIELGSVQLWELLSGVPTGPQTVEVFRPSSARRQWAVAFTVTAGTDVEVTGTLLEQEDQALTEENVDDGSPGTNSTRYMALFSGKPNPTTQFTTGANSVRLHETNFSGAGRSAVFVREATAGQGARPVGLIATSDDVAALYFAVREVSGPPPSGGASGIFGGWASPLKGVVIR